MVNIVIVGWYGTETIGDRAILSGLFNLFAEVYDSFKIQLGTFYPVLTDRTLLEDFSFYNQIACGKMKSVTRFDSSKTKELNNAIDRSDMVVVGGGPMAEISQIYMLEYAFARAKKKNKKTALLGCGVGPFVSKSILSCFYRLLKKADLRIFRDDNLGKMGLPFNREEYYLSCDPAVFAATFFVGKSTEQKQYKNFISVNFREVVSGVDLKQNIVQNLFAVLLQRLLEETNSEIRLIPMHTFYVGGDDRYTLNRLADTIKSDRIYVQNEPLNLEETMRVYFDSLFCIGMRYHSVLLQTLLNGKNYILDYTNPVTGKTFHFLKIFNLSDDYRGRYISLVKGDCCIFEFTSDCKQIQVDNCLVKKYRSVYTENLASLFS